jgi:myosin-5
MPQFIRCIKPNEKQEHSLLEPVLTLNQLKYSGLFEAIRIRQSGYPLRMTHEQFLDALERLIGEAMRWKQTLGSVDAPDRQEG